MNSILASLKSFSIKLYLKKLKRQRQSSKISIREKRKMFEEVSKRFKGHKVPIKKIAANGIPSWLFEYEENKNKVNPPVVMFLHGGAYAMGSLYSHRSICERICTLWKVNLLSVEYRLAPEYPFPAAADDAISAYLWLTANYPQSNISIVGDSAGGGLALSVCKKLIEDKERKPDSLILFAPWTDLSCNSLNMKANDAKDPVLSRAELKAFAKMYAGNQQVNHPYISPIHLNFNNFPQVFIQVGENDLLLEDSEKLYQKLVDNGVEAELDVWKNMWHVFQLFSMIPQANKALKVAGNKIPR